jgi:hypothetical protein
MRHNYTDISALVFNKLAYAEWIRTLCVSIKAGRGAILDCISVRYMYVQLEYVRTRIFLMFVKGTTIAYHTNTRQVNNLVWYAIAVPFTNVKKIRVRAYGTRTIRQG